jgi:hypothetical protein
VYAVGCVLYEMLAGQAPFVGDTAIAIALAHTRQPVPDVRRARPDISPGVAAATERALAKDPAERFANAGDMRRALRGEAVAAAYEPTVPLGATAAATQVLPADERAERPRPSRAPLAILALAALALLGALLASQLSADDPPRERNRQQQRRDPAPAASEVPTEAPPPPVEPTAAPPDPTEPPEEEPTEPPDPAQIIPRDIPSLIQLLTVQPGIYGPKQEDLRKGLEKVNSQEGDKQADSAAKLYEQTGGWIEDGEINPDIGNLSRMLLEPLAAQADDGDDDGDPGQGKGKGKGKDDD